MQKELILIELPKPTLGVFFCADWPIGIVDCDVFGLLPIVSGKQSSDSPFKVDSTSKHLLVHWIIKKKIVEKLIKKKNYI